LSYISSDWPHYQFSNQPVTGPYLVKSTHYLSAHYLSVHYLFAHYLFAHYLFASFSSGTKCPNINSRFLSASSIFVFYITLTIIICIFFTFNICIFITLLIIISCIFCSLCFCS
jgi:hypothetical protein